MTGRISEETIREIRERADIVEVVASYLPLKRSGGNHQGLCPFHSEKTPSFNVNAPRQIFHCFGCGVGGDVFSFLMRMEGLAFPEAVRRVAERVGIEIAEETVSPEEERRRKEREDLLRINEVACAYYHQVLLEAPEAAAARRYLRERGYDGETARTFRLGFAPGRWEALAEHLAQKGFDPRQIRETGLTRPGKDGRGDYDLFRNRILFPILDVSGKVSAFGGRVLDDSLPKYINSPESPVYHKGRVLYGFSQARESMRKRDEVIVVEGYFDLLALHRAGFANVVATCGTALTEDHARLLKRYVKRVKLLFDQDRAGEAATFRAMEALLPGGLSVSAVALDAGEDPDSFLASRGAETFRDRLEAARPVFELYIDSLLRTHGDAIEGRARAAEEIAASLTLVPSDIERSLYLKALSERTGLDVELLKSKVVKKAPAPPAKPAPRAPEPEPGGHHPIPPEDYPPERHPPQPPAYGERKGPPATRSAARPQEPTREQKAQDWVLRLMMFDAKTRGVVAEEGVSSFFFEPNRRAMAAILVECSAEADEVEETHLLTRFDEEQKAVFSGILVKDEEAFAEDRERILQDCRLVVAKESLRRRVRELDEQIRQAEQAGDVSRQAALQTERLQLSRDLKK